MLPMLHARHHGAFRSGIAGQFIGDHHTRSRTLLLEQPPQQALGRCRIAAALNQDVEYDPMLIDGAPEPMLLASDADDNLIKVPLVSWRWRTPADLVSETLAELHCPLPDGLMTDLDPSGC